MKQNEMRKNRDKNKDNEILQENKGKVFTATEIKKLFNYSKDTNVQDIYLFQKNLIYQLKWNTYIIV